MSGVIAAKRRTLLSCTSLARNGLIALGTAAAFGTAAFGAARVRLSLDVLNMGSHPVRVRNAAHFFAVDRALKFDRAATYGMRLDCSTRAGMRFPPGEIVRVSLVPMDPSALAHGTERHVGGMSHMAEVRRRGLRHA